MGSLGANGVRQGIGHRSMQEGSDKTAGAKGIDITSRPHIAHTSIGSEDGITVSYFIEDVRDVLGVDRLHVLDIASVRADRGLHNLGVALNCGLKEFVIMLFQQRGDGVAQGFHIGMDREGHVSTASQLLRTVLNLDSEGIWEELVVGEIGS